MENVVLKDASIFEQRKWNFTLTLVIKTLGHNDMSSKLHG